MMGLTHAAIAATGAALLMQTTDPLTLGLAVIGSQLPDLDTSTSLIGQLCYPISHRLEDCYPHRTITHSVLATAAIALVSFGVWFFVREKLGFGIAVAAALPLGHVLSTFSDTCTKQGVQLFWGLTDDPVWCVFGMNPRRRLRTGGTAEYWVVAIVVLVLAVTLNLNAQGGLKQVATDKLNLNDPTVEKTYNESAATNHIWATIEGYKASDRAPFTGRLLVIGEESGFVVMSEVGAVYKIGDGIVSEKLKTEPGDAATTTLSAIAFDDEETVPKLQQLVTQHQGSLVLLTGQLSVDFAEDVPVELQPDQLQTLRVTGDTVTLNYCPIEKAIALLNDQWSIGQLNVKIISPSPWGA